MEAAGGLNYPSSYYQTWCVNNVDIESFLVVKQSFAVRDRIVAKMEANERFLNVVK